MRKEKRIMENFESVEKVNRQLYDKLYGELKVLLDDLKQKPAEIAINHSFEIAVKSDICFWFETGDLTVPQAKSLLAMDNSLNAIFDNWMDKYSYMDTIRECIEDRADTGIPKINALEIHQER
jgi:hypothetical protein